MRNMFLSRLGIYMVVFNICDLAASDDDKKSHVCDFISLKGQRMQSLMVLSRVIRAHARAKISTVRGFRCGSLGRMLIAILCYCDATAHSRTLTAPRRFAPGFQHVKEQSVAVAVAKGRRFAVTIRTRKAKPNSDPGMDAVVPFHSIRPVAGAVAAIAGAIAAASCHHSAVTT